MTRRSRTLRPLLHNRGQKSRRPSRTLNATRVKNSRKTFINTFSWICISCFNRRFVWPLNFDWQATPRKLNIETFFSVKTLSFHLKKYFILKEFCESFNARGLMQIHTSLHTSHLRPSGLHDDELRSHWALCWRQKPPEHLIHSFSSLKSSEDSERARN